MKFRSPLLPAHVVLGAQTALDDLAAPLAGLRTALVVTPDGFEIAQLQRSSLNIAKLAAMTSSLMAMARAVGGELAFTDCRRLVFDAEQGTVAVQPVPAAFPSLLCFVLGPDATLGRALWTMGEVVSALRKID
ncbi:roadblock/LC7 domain-containing protein [Variovorax sp. PAMC26660]|uniref:roadblock/LC7 domain-containing protein n=1 Tax=Variovorax sp. PAMC26660 TaxID=2762322 RepID=UPI00164D24DE|nr:roadblock/LC7 domain-containing protein [Variovorax sp. PAMC26660]QNK65857.1 roadblock/LC7 domain-containing protein [Variovorax sp. PAMC26660]